MRVSFKSYDLQEIYENKKEKRKPIYDETVIKAFIKKIDILYALNNSHELTQLKSLHFEFLKKEYKGFCSIRVNEKYRIIFKIIKEKSSKETIEICEIYKLTDYH